MTNTQRRVNAIRRESGDNRARLRSIVLRILSNKAKQEQTAVSSKSSVKPPPFLCTTASDRKPQREWTQLRKTPQRRTRAA